MKRYAHRDNRWFEVTAEEPLPAEQLFWLDFTHREDSWPLEVERLLGCTVHERHIKDSLNVSHPPYYDATSDYEMIICRPLDGLQSNDLTLDTTACAIFLFARGVVTVRASDNTLFEEVARRLQSNTPKQPESVTGVLHAVLHRIVEEQMRVRVPLSLQLDNWQTRLFQSSGFKDWQPLLDLRSRLRTFSVLLTEQLASLTLWRSETELPIGEHVEVRLSDVMEHIKRVLHDLDVMQHDIEGMIQIYFSLTGQRTNDIVRVLTIISVIFLPLNLIAGVFGMNFERMPLLADSFGFWTTAIGMSTIALALILLLRLKRWL